MTARTDPKHLNRTCLRERPTGYISGERRDDHDQENDDQDSPLVLHLLDCWAWGCRDMLTWLRCAQCNKRAVTMFEGTALCRKYN